MYGDNSTMARKIDCEVISAGFVNCNLQCFGESISLKIKSREDIDTRLCMNMFGTTEEDLKLQRS